MWGDCYTKIDCFFQTSEVSNSEATVCECNHLTSFGGDFFVPPNTIHFNTVFDDLGSKLLDNNAVLIFICVLLATYFPVAIWARRKDKQDLVKV